MRALGIASTGMIAQQIAVDGFANNMANVQTPGYKKMRAAFQTLLYQKYRSPGSGTSTAGTINPAGANLGLGVKLASIYRVNEQGPIVPTNNPLHLAVEGKGYFRIELPNGTIAYTRDGTFERSPEGVLVTSDGYTLQPAITLPEDTLFVTINAYGEVIAETPGNQQQNIGQVELVNFNNENGLQPMGSNLFAETQASGGPIVGNPGAEGFGTTLQGYIENSNVEPVSEITELVKAQRAYEMNSQVVKVADEMMATHTRMRG